MGLSTVWRETNPTGMRSSFSPAYIVYASTSDFWLAKQAEPHASSLAARKLGIRTAIKIAIMAITTNNSINVKPFDLLTADLLKNRR